MQVMSWVFGFGVCECLEFGVCVCVLFCCPCLSAPFQWYLTAVVPVCFLLIAMRV